MASGLWPDVASLRHCAISCSEVSVSGVGPARLELVAISKATEANAVNENRQTRFIKGEVHLLFDISRLFGLACVRRKENDD